MLESGLAIWHSYCSPDFNGLSSVKLNRCAGQLNFLMFSLCVAEPPYSYPYESMHKSRYAHEWRMDCHQIWLGAPRTACCNCKDLHTCPTAS